MQIIGNTCNSSMCFTAYLMHHTALLQLSLCTELSRMNLQPLTTYLAANKCKYACMPCTYIYIHVRGWVYFIADLVRTFLAHPCASRFLNKRLAQTSAKFLHKALCHICCTMQKETHRCMHLAQVKLKSWFTVWEGSTSRSLTIHPLPLLPSVIKTSDLLLPQLVCLTFYNLACQKFQIISTCNLHVRSKSVITTC